MPKVENDLLKLDLFKIKKEKNEELKFSENKIFENPFLKVKKRSMWALRMGLVGWPCKMGSCMRAQGPKC